ncbi:unnamed protein product, partial [Candidula unifasciata]
MAYRKTAIEAPDYTYIPGGLNVGAQIIVRGRVAFDQERFHINLQNDQVEGCDVAFHFNPRTEAQTVVRNSFSGCWQQEERNIPYFPFAKGSKFTVRIYYFIEYRHRLPFQNVRYLKLSEGAEYYESTIQNPCVSNKFAINFNSDIDGNVVGVLHFKPRKTGLSRTRRGQGWFPFPRGEYFDVVHFNTRSAFPPEQIYFLNIYGDPNDYIKQIPSGLEKNDLIAVKGFFYPEGNTFAVNLINGTSLGNDIALHFNPRRNQDTVVINNQRNGCWKKEERHPLPSQFQQKLPFEVEIVNKGKKFKIYVNGHRFASFKARGDVEDIKGINVQGEAYIYEVKLLRRL